LTKHLPADSATAEAIHGAGWSTTEHLLALIADQLAAANWQRAGDKTKPRPQPLPRPGEQRGLAMSGAEIQRRLLAQREG
jgi:hypothetical protein